SASEFYAEVRIVGVLTALDRADLNDISSMTLTEIQALQVQIDDQIWNGPDDPEGKRHHVLLHLMILAAKLARAEERREHGIEFDDPVDECIGDLVVFAAQLAELSGRSLAAVYETRVR